MREHCYDCKGDITLKSGELCDSCVPGITANYRVMRNNRDSWRKRCELADRVCFLLEEPIRDRRDQAELWMALKAWREARGEK